MKNKLLLLFWMILGQNYSNAQTDTTTIGNILNIDSIIKVADQFSSQQKYVDAVNTLYNALYDQPKYCIIKHKYLKAYFLSGSSSINFATDVLNNTPFENHDCSPWSVEERCEAMELLSHYFFFEAMKANYNSAKIDSMFIYADSIKLLCNRTPSFPGFEAEAANRKQALASLNPTASTYGILQIIDRIDNPDSVRSLFKLAFQLAETKEDYFDLGWKLSNSNQYKESMNCYRKLFDISNDDKTKREAYNFQVGILIDQNLIDSAIHVQSRLPSKLKLSAEDICDNKEQVGDIYFNAGKYTAAIKQYDLTLAGTNDLAHKSHLYKKISDAYYKMGDVKNGYKFYIMAQ